MGTGANEEALNKWIQETRQGPVPVRYTLTSLCDVLEAGIAKQKCLSAAPKYCPARVDSWKSDYPFARCDSPTTLTTTTTTPASTDCKGCAPHCCSGGCAAMDGQWSDDNFVDFEGLPG